jgi:hypothetical protein
MIWGFDVLPLAAKQHVEHVRRMMREGSIEGVKIGLTWLVKRAAQERHMKPKASISERDPSHN